MSSFQVGINNTRPNRLKALTINYLAKEPTYVDAFYIKVFRSPNYSQNINVTKTTFGFVTHKHN